MIDALKSAAGRVAETIHEHRERGDGFAVLCRSLGIKPDALVGFVEEETAKLNGSGTVEGALMHGTLIGILATASSGTADRLPTDGDLDWATIGMLLAPHEVRTRILRHLYLVGTDSPNSMAKALDEPLGNISYHVKALLGEHNDKPIKDKPLVELVKTEPRRGAVEHFYRLTPAATGGKERSADA